MTPRRARTGSRFAVTRVAVPPAPCTEPAAAVSSTILPGTWRAAAAMPLVALVCALAWPAAAAAAQVEPLPEAFAPRVKYTVKIASKVYGNAQQTRIIRSGQTDDYTWRTAASGAPASVPPRCPNASRVPVDANGKPVRQIQLRVAPIVDQHNVANLQLYFSGRTVQGTTNAMADGKRLVCPKDVSFSQIAHLSLPINGKTKTVALSDGTQISLSAEY